MIDERKFDFSVSLSAAMAAHEANSSLTLLVSVEPDPLEFDRFWSDLVVVFTLSPSFLAFRLRLLRNSEELHSFRGRHNLEFTSSLLCFESGSLSSASSWFSKCPTPSAFHARFRERSFSLPGLVKIFAIAGTRTKTRVFKKSDTILMLKLWIDHEFGSDWQITVVHTNLPLPEDDSLAVSDLGPCAILQLNSPELAMDWTPLPLVRRENFAESEAKRESPSAKIDFRSSSSAQEMKWPTLIEIFDFFNPWPDATETEDFFVTKYRV
jgi:hypothetical protein